MNLVAQVAYVWLIGLWTNTLPMSVGAVSTSRSARYPHRLVLAQFTF
jgi:hypothetical protein